MMFIHDRIIFDTICGSEAYLLGKTTPSMTAFVNKGHPVKFPITPASLK